MTRRARMIAHATGRDGLAPDDLTRWAVLDDAPAFAELEAEARAAADADPVARHDLAYLTPELIAGAALTRANLTAQKAEATRPLSPEEAAQAYEIAKAGAARLGYETVAEYLDAVDPLPPPRRTTGPELFPEPEDRGTAALSALGEVEYVDDLIRPGRIVVVAAEEGAGKSYAIGGELAVRVAVAGGLFAGTWPVRQTGPLLYMSEMHADDDFGREATVLSSLGLDRSALVARYYRLPLMTAAGGRPALTVPDWRTWITHWLRDHGALLLVVDTATAATQVDPWGREIQAVYTALRVMLAEYPELAIVLLIHLKKPASRGARRISDVLGEWGRWCDVVILMENDGAGLTRARLTVRKRVRHERRIVVTKAGGLLIDPQDLDEAKGTKVPAEDVIAAVVARPGMTYVELGAALGVSKDTASNYVKALGDQLHTVKGTARSGPGARARVYSIAESPNIAEQARFGDPPPRPIARPGRQGRAGGLVPRGRLPAERLGPARRRGRPGGRSAARPDPRWRSDMSDLQVLGARGELVERYVARIEAHLARFAQGHDPMGHLFAIERLARGARAEWWAEQRSLDRERRVP